MEVGRRDVIKSGMLLAMIGDGLVNAAQAAPVPAVEPAPQLEFIIEIIADIAETEDLGAGPLGQRRIVPIIGGVFSGPRLRGKVRSGGADRQLVRADGVRQLVAQYELETHDGVVISIVNKVLVENFKDGGRYAFSNVEITAPAGPYDWLNHGVFVGTLGSLKPARSAVRVRFYKLF